MSVVMKGNTEKCISCGKCTESCAFLKKYNLDFNVKNEERLKKLAFHCFLCGKCTEVCPIGVDGREHMLALRQEKVRESDGKLKGYRMMRLEKKNYIFKNYRKANKKSILFPGCNFPSLYPETTKYLIKLFESYDIGVAMDCCGKPIAELGLVEEEKRIIKKLSDRIKENNIEEIIMLCPNCYDYLSDRLPVKIVSIYEKLEELNIGSKINIGSDPMFKACPQRKGNDWMKYMDNYLQDYKMLENDHCCGLGGGAAAEEKQLADKFTARVPEKIYVYCASCAGRLASEENRSVYHILPKVLGINEKPDIKHSLLNRSKFHIQV